MQINRITNYTEPKCTDNSKNSTVYNGSSNPAVSFKADYNKFRLVTQNTDLLDLVTGTLKTKQKGFTNGLNVALKRYIPSDNLFHDGVSAAVKALTSQTKSGSVITFNLIDSKSKLGNFLIEAIEPLNNNAGKFKYNYAKIQISGDSALVETGKKIDLASECANLKEKKNATSQNAKQLNNFVKNYLKELMSDKNIQF